MLYKDYVIHSLVIFFVCFVLGTFVNREFKKYQLSLRDVNNTTRFKLAVLQLLVVITLTYILQYFRLFHYFFETYNPSVLFSTFLLSLQNNMLNNFSMLI
jgi:hypothetical protein